MQGKTLNELKNDDFEISSREISMKSPESLKLPRKRLYKADKCRYNFPVAEYMVPRNATEAK